MTFLLSILCQFSVIEGDDNNYLVSLYSSMDGQLTFIDTADMSIMNKQDHTNVTDVGWDPTGRYVVSSVSFWTLKVKLKTAFNKIVWNTTLLLLCYVLSLSLPVA